MAKKAKWLEEATNAELMVIIAEGIDGDEKAVKKAKKAMDELQERTPDGELSVEDALALLEAATDAVRVAYETEAEAADEDEDDADEEDDEDDDDADDEDDLDSMTKKELFAYAKELGVAGITRKSTKSELLEAIEEFEGEEDEDDDEDDVDYSELSKAELLAECKERGLKANRKMKSKDIIAILEEDDEE